MTKMMLDDWDQFIYDRIVKSYLTFTAECEGALQSNNYFSLSWTFRLSDEFDHTASS